MVLVRFLRGYISYVSVAVIKPYDQGRMKCLFNLWFWRYPCVAGKDGREQRVWRQAQEAKSSDLKERAGSGENQLEVPPGF